MTRWIDTLNYSSVNEDWRTEWAALKLGAQHRVLCVTGSGDRPLDLLAREDVQVVAIDTCRAQNHLLRLKIAAMRALDFQAYARFLGLHEASATWRRATLDSLPLEASCAAWWAARPRDIGRGVLYRGRFERHFRRISRLARLLRGPAIRELLAFDDLEAQRRFVDQRWDTAAWRSVYALVTDPRISRLFYGDPAYYAHVQVDVGPYLFARMARSLHHTLARDSFMVHLVLTGRLSPRDLPPYLTPAGVARIRPRLDQIEVVDAELLSWLDSSGRSFDRFSVSDVPSYLDDAGFEALVRALDRAAAPGARVAIRQFLTRYTLPEGLGWVREPELEARLALEDRAFAYEFLIAEVRP